MADSFGQIIKRLRAQKTDDAFVEAKASAKKLSSDVWDSVSAFANTAGGLLVLGLSEGGGSSLPLRVSPSTRSEISSSRVSAMVALRVPG